MPQVDFEVLQPAEPVPPAVETKKQAGKPFKSCCDHSNSLVKGSVKPDKAFAEQDKAFA